ncbi:MAG: helicase-related protein [Kiritimatiellae bacterium]|nr:helicase-related protein [Kiritimatiellia bacterium]
MEEDLIQHLQDRMFIIRSLRESICGPKPAGKERPIPSQIAWEDIPFRQPDGEEVLDDSPLLRYGAGVLYPPEVKVDQEEEGGTPDLLGDEQGNGVPAEIHKASSVGEADSNDFDIAAINKLKQSSLGISFYVDFENTDSMKVLIPTRTCLHGDEENIPVNGIYRAVNIQIGDNPALREFWYRSPFSKDNLSIDVDLNELKSNSYISKTFYSLDSKTRIDLKVYLRIASVREENHGIITVCLVNQSASSQRKKMAEQSLFQTYFEVEVEDSSGRGGIKPYPQYKSAYEDEERSIDLLYRHRQTFGIGHGCSADWNKEHTESRTVRTVSAEVLPIFEDKSLTPNITDENENPFRVPMINLMEESGLSDLKKLADLYENWIKKQNGICEQLDSFELQQTLVRHIKVCDECLKRIRRGIDWLEQDETALLAFQLANKAMVMQKFLGHSGTERAVTRDRNGVNKVEGTAGYQKLEDVPVDKTIIGDLKLADWCWRPFQIAFILMSLQSSADGSDEFRNNVELIWFPTGGGKTEAYLGLAAFTIFYRRLQDQKDTGTHVLMRYTLRLLTTQQFQRASRLICAMELIRGGRLEKLGDAAFSIGIWVGGENTPNSRLIAKSALREIQRYPNRKNPFIHESCPWCGASFKYSIRVRNNQFPGYAEHGQTVVFSCPDERCSFYGLGRLPIYVIDEDVYDFRPDIIIGTVDKFAQLIWRPDVRALFGIADDGSRFASPPGLIIQDELHLISGPLGSMCGLFETIIDELCTDRRGEKGIPPKIVCSTATIRRFEEQVKNLFARSKVTLFPPPGSEADDSFFAVTAQYDDGRDKPGQIYIGINAPGYSSLTFAQVVVYTVLLHAAKAVSDDPQRQDPWWTLLTFYNSLRELGTALTLFQTDIPDYQKVLRRQTAEKTRFINKVEELTSRLSNEEIPRVLAKLSTGMLEKGVVDACLASSIIEVGIDVGRLCMMSIIGQPKTTAQYIQVSGRVGRNKPGVVFTFYSPHKPRDRSHYERFRSYHENLYAQVEPTSVTPFAPPVLTRSLHAVLTAGIRQLGDKELTKHPNNLDDNLVSKIADLLSARACALLDPADMAHFTDVLNKKRRDLKIFSKEKWVNNAESGADAQLCYAGEYIDKKNEGLIWPTQTSMRNVDATCQAEITLRYLKKSNL